MVFGNQISEVTDVDGEGLTWLMNELRIVTLRRNEFNSFSKGQELNGLLSFVAPLMRSKV